MGFIFDGVQSIAIIILIEVQTVPSLVNWNLFQLMEPINGNSPNKSASFLSEIARSSRLILYISCLTPGISHFSKKH